MRSQTKEQRAALRDLKRTVRSFMKDAEKLAMEKIDKLQASGCDIAGDHISLTKSNGPILVPRDFIAAFAEEMKHAFGCVRKEDKSRNKRIKNYYLMM